MTATDNLSSAMDLSVDPGLLADKRLGWAKAVRARYDEIMRGATWTPSGWGDWSLHAAPTNLGRGTVALRAEVGAGAGLRSVMLFSGVRPRRIRPYCMALLRGLRRHPNLPAAFDGLIKLPDPDVPDSVVERLDADAVDPVLGRHLHALSTIAELEGAAVSD